jgi:hypothetical protein
LLGHKLGATSLVIRRPDHLGKPIRNGYDDSVLRSIALLVEGQADPSGRQLI